MSVGSMSDSDSGESTSSFLKDLEVTLKEGEDDVEEGKKMFEKQDKQKRDRDKANEPSTDEGLNKYTNKNDPNLILKFLPRETSAALSKLQSGMMPVCLTGYLSRHVEKLTAANQTLVRIERTQYDKFVVLAQAMKEEGIEFERQVHF